jgi:hypothetical protein
VSALRVSVLLIVIGVLLVWPTGAVVTGLSVVALGAILIVVGVGGALAALASRGPRRGSPPYR